MLFYCLSDVILPIKMSQKQKKNKTKEKQKNPNWFVRCKMIFQFLQMYKVKNSSLHYHGAVMV